MKSFYRYLALLLVLLMILPVLSACAQSSSTKKETETVKEKTAEDTKGTESKPKIKDITITVGLDQEPDTLDRHKSSATLTRWVTDPMHDTLVTTDESGAVLEPAVAKSWKYASDTQIVFELRDNVYFHNGRQVKAKDIVFSLEYVANKDNGSTHYESIGKFIEKVEANGDYTVTLTLNQPYYSALLALTNVPILCEEAMDTFASAPIGCGPFKFVRWDKNSKVVMEAFDKYYQEGIPTYKNLVMNFYSDTSTCLTAYLAGEIDIIHWVNQVDVDTVLATGDSYLYEGVSSWRYLTGNQKDPILSTPGVMKAISLAVDKQQIVDLVINGYGEGAVTWEPHTHPYYPKHLDYEPNIEEAKRLLAEAGYPNGFKVTLIAPQTASEGGAATVVQQQLKKIGIETELTLMEVPTFLETMKQRDYQLLVCGSTLKADPYLQGRVYISDSPNNHSLFKSERYDELLKQSCLVTDENERIKLFHEAFEIMLEDPVWITLFIEYKLVALRNNIKGFIYRPAYQDYTRLYIED